jgi:hypothetical protein
MAAALSEEQQDKPMVRACDENIKNTSHLLKYMFAHEDVYKYFQAMRTLFSALLRSHP